MFAVLAVAFCCVVIPLVVGLLAFLGLSKKDKTAVKQEAANPQLERGE